MIKENEIKERKKCLDIVIEGDIEEPASLEGKRFCVKTSGPTGSDAFVTIDGEECQDIVVIDIGIAKLPTLNASTHPRVVAPGEAPRILVRNLTGHYKDTALDLELNEGSVHLYGASQPSPEIPLLNFHLSITTTERIICCFNFHPDAFEDEVIYRPGPWIRKPAGVIYTNDAPDLSTATSDIGYADIIDSCDKLAEDERYKETVLPEMPEEISSWCLEVEAKSGYTFKEACAIYPSASMFGVPTKEIIALGNLSDGKVPLLAIRTYLRHGALGCLGAIRSSIFTPHLHWHLEEYITQPEKQTIDELTEEYQLFELKYKRLKQACFALLVAAIPVWEALQAFQV